MFFLLPCILDSSSLICILYHILHTQINIKIISLKIISYTFHPNLNDTFYYFIFHIYLTNESFKLGRREYNTNKLNNVRTSINNESYIT